MLFNRSGDIFFTTQEITLLVIYCRIKVNGTVYVVYDNNQKNKYLFAFGIMGLLFIIA